MFKHNLNDNISQCITRLKNIPISIFIVTTFLLLLPTAQCIVYEDFELVFLQRSLLFYIFVMTIFSFFSGFIGSFLIFILSLALESISLFLFMQTSNFSWFSSTIVWHVLYLVFFLFLMAVILGWFGTISLRQEIKIKSLEKELEALRLEDPFTGMPNERFFLAKLEEEILRCKRNDNCFSLVYLDVHTFNYVYETYLPLLENNLPPHLGQEIKKLIRGIDVIAQINPEIFILLLVDTSEDKALEAIERIKTRLECQLDIHNLTCREELNLCLGHICFPNAGGTVTELMVKVKSGIARNREMLRNIHGERLQRSEKFAVIGQLSAGLAHEIRNPLTSVRGFIQLLQYKNNGKPNPEYIEIIMSELDRVNKLVREFLELAKPTPPKREKVIFNEILNRAVFFMHSQCNLKDVYIEVDPDPEMSILCLDKEQIMQVLINLINNSIEAMPKGGRIEISAKVVNNYLTCQIKDNGLGISPKDLERIFEPFHSTKEEGTGLGLAITSRIIKNHGGRIKVASDLGRGATFTIYLPTKNHE